MRSSVDKDYRYSHQGAERSERYHRKFKENPYRAMMWSLERASLGRIMGKWFSSNRPRHLDIACGSGRIVGQLQSQCRASMGVDISEAMVAIAQRENPGAEIRVADISQPAVLGERRFELITAFRFFPNAQPDLRRQVMQAASDHLADGGILVFNNHKNAQSLIYLLASMIRLKGRSGVHRQEMERLVGACGLEITETHYLGVVPSTEKYRLLPAGLLKVLERLLCQLPGLRGLAVNQIYVARRLPAAD